MDEKKIDLPTEELKLASLCIDYLNLPTFLKPPTETAVLNGDYSLIDYAVLYWIRHFEAGILQADGHDHLIKELAESLDIFIEKHWCDPTTPLPVSKRNSDRLYFFKDLPFYNKLEQTVVSTRKQLTFFGKMRKEEIALDLGDIVSNVRKVLEYVVSSRKEASVEADMELKYGSNLFKCPRFSCQFFTTGFPSPNDREKHIGKHDRPFRCTYEACTGFIFGFTSAAEREKHMNETHSITTIEDKEFPTDQDVQRSMQSDNPPEVPTTADPVESAELEQELLLNPLPSQHRSRRKETRKEFKCNHCSKSYTKRYNWTSHLLTHATDRPYICLECDTSFARFSDLKRHESKHFEKTHVCRGVLKNGEQWGCGKSFSRADILSSHHKSKTGSVCLLPLLQEQEMEHAVRQDVEV